jgi:GAF domain-containing protein
VGGGRSARDLSLGRGARRNERALAAAQANLQAGAFDVALELLAMAEAQGSGPLDELQSARVDLLRGQIAFASSAGSDAPALLLKAARSHGRDRAPGRGDTFSMACTATQSLSSGPGGADDVAGIDHDVQEIVAEQAALRRVATLVARGACHEVLFAVVNRELAQLVRADAAALLRFEQDETITLVAAWNAAGPPVPAGEQEPVTAALRRLRDTARPVRFGPTGIPLTGPFVAEIRRLGIRASVAVPIQVDGRVWGSAWPRRGARSRSRRQPKRG